MLFRHSSLADVSDASGLLLRPCYDAQLCPVAKADNRDAEFKARAKEICYSVSVAQLQNPRPTMDALWNPGCEEKKSRKRKGVMQRAKAGKKSKDLCSDEGKKTQGTSNSVEKGKFQGKIS
ncbi:hypothetical protein Ancab_023225 [Ancistrocladus abbreviatus]